jgi:hypothetical protein
VEEILLSIRIANEAKTLIPLNPFNNAGRHRASFSAASARETDAREVGSLEPNTNIQIPTRNDPTMCGPSPAMTMG